ncbi:hypothetical protein DID78_03315 [Candidatus Marinamargulisbacteria bacterium SCGC AG-343-D04]|nr:hypothetical protein DID78_03315 [Candidatus Marinamargulisbacteria bacterium SCGC AG-343-D04]
MDLTSICTHLYYTVSNEYHHQWESIFFNLLTIIVACECLDDELWSKISPDWLKKRLNTTTTLKPFKTLIYADLTAVSVLILLSINLFINLFRSLQLMNESFLPFHIVNTYYGDFRSVGKKRQEIIIEWTMDSVLDNDPQWNAYSFKK